MTEFEINSILDYFTDIKDNNYILYDVLVNEITQHKVLQYDPNQVVDLSDTLNAKN